MQMSIKRIDKIKAQWIEEPVTEDNRIAE